MEPMINYLIDEKKWGRKRAVVSVGLAAFLFGVPSALSFSWLKRFTFAGYTFFDVVVNFTLDFLIPIGGLVAVFYVGWVWGFKKAYPYLAGDSDESEGESSLLRAYLSICIRYVAPALILVVLLSNLI